MMMIMMMIMMIMMIMIMMMMMISRIPKGSLKASGAVDDVNSIDTTTITNYYY